MERFNPAFGKNDWIADAGTTSHIAPDRRMFTDFRAERVTVNGFGEGMHVEGEGRGTVILNSRVEGKIIPITLKDVIYLPTAVNSLLSIAKIDKGGGSAEYRNGEVILRSKNNTVMGKGKLSKGIYLLDAKAVRHPGMTEYANFATHARALTWDEWHRALGHLAMSSIEKLARSGIVTGLNIDPNSTPSISCEACIRGKAIHNKFPKETTERGHLPGDLTYSDLWGPARTAAIGSKYYYISFTDDATRHIEVRFLNKKPQAFQEIKNYIALIETQFGRTPKKLRVDSGTEFINDEVKSYCASKGIEVETTAPYSHEQLGIAERFNRTLMELARSMLIHKKLPLHLWAEAVRYAAYIRSRVATRALKDKTPIEAWTNQKSDISHLREFGTEVYILDEGDRSKLDEKAKKHIFVGFEDGPKAIRYYNPSTGRIGVSRNAYFIEDAPTNKIEINLRTRREIEDELPMRDESPIEGEKESDGNRKLSPKLLPTIPTQRAESPPAPEIEESIQPPQITEVRRSTRAREEKNYAKLHNPQARKEIIPAQQARPEVTSPKGIDPEIAIANSAMVRDRDEKEFAFALRSAEGTAFEFDAPDSMREAINGPEADQWLKARDEETNQILKMGTWTLEKPPDGANILKCAYIFTKKYNADGKLRYKARLVVKGYSQIPGQDFNDTFAPVMRMDSMRSILALAAIYDLELGQMDIKGAYLNGDLKEEIYMAQPPGYDDGSGRVCRLHKTLYGLKQSGREWNIRLNTFLTEKAGYARHEKDRCVYMRRDSNGYDIVGVWVDDLILQRPARPA